jgi:hypothetical protein
MAGRHEKALPFLEERDALASETPHLMVERDRAGALRGYRLFQPHAHLSLLTRTISPTGFGGKLELMNRRRQLYFWRQ